MVNQLQEVFGLSCLFGTDLTIIIIHEPFINIVDV